VAAVLDGNPAVVRLVDRGSAKLLASLTPPEELPTHTFVFSPDGRFLAVSRSDQRVDIWDLAAVQRRLNELGLAQEIAPVFNGAAPPGDAAAVQQVVIRGTNPVGLRFLAARLTLQTAWFRFRSLFDGRLEQFEDLLERARCWERLGHWDRAAADYRELIRRRPGVTAIANECAWYHVMHRGDIQEAVRLARGIVEREPNVVQFQNTLAAALYRNGDFTQAADILAGNIQRSATTSRFDWVFLAMCRHRVGQAAETRDALAQALRRRSGNIQLYVDDFEQLLREAESMINGYPSDLPDDVFAR
jgi:tetratricopeptide (TPR) repeat protein